MKETCLGLHNRAAAERMMHGTDSVGFQSPQGIYGCWRSKVVLSQSRFVFEISSPAAFHRPTMNTQTPAIDESHILALERPHPGLWKYYLICAILTGPAIIITLPFLYFRYHTLRYRFDAEGIHMRVGILFRREINLTYARIQDIHLKSSFIQRWLGLANLEIQTASGSAAAELVIEGFKEFEAIRDFLYIRMRGYQTHGKRGAGIPTATTPGTESNAEVVPLLQAIRDELRQTRLVLESASNATQPPTNPPGHV